MKKNFWGSDRKLLVMILGIVIVSIMTVTLAYAALSVTLNIQGSARVSAADWDIYLGNQVINEGSVSDSTLNVSGTKATFDATFNMPGDYYEFTIDVINGGDIDAIITNVNKSSLTTDQAKLFDYTVKYQNGASINTNQRLDKGSYLRLLVRVDYKKDINNVDLPSSQLTVDFSFDVEFTQSDGVTGDAVENNGVNVQLINFSVDGHSFQAEQGMTWETWISSDYNTVGEDIYLSGSDVWSNLEWGSWITVSSLSDYENYQIAYDTSYIVVAQKGDQIINNESYLSTP